MMECGREILGRRTGDTHGQQGQGNQELEEGGVDEPEGEAPGQAGEEGLSDESIGAQ